MWWHIFTYAFIDGETVTPLVRKLCSNSKNYGFDDAIILSAHDRCINVEEYFGVLGERRRGLEVLEFWEIFVRDLYGRFGNRGIA
jgi:hypothetical protein